MKLPGLNLLLLGMAVLVSPYAQGALLSAESGRPPRGSSKVVKQHGLVRHLSLARVTDFRRSLMSRRTAPGFRPGAVQPVATTAAKGHTRLAGPQGEFQMTQRGVFW